MRATPLVTAATAALLLLPAGCDEPATDQPARKAAVVPAPAPAGEKRVELSVETDAATVQLGGPIVLHVTVTNSGEEEVRVNVPRLGRKSVTIRVRAEGQSARWLDRIHADLGQRGPQIVLEWRMPEAKTLAAGESVTSDIPLTALQAGKHTFTAKYRYTGAKEPLLADPVTVDVLPDGKKRQLGVKLETSEGDVTVRLRADLAFNTAESFASLVANGFYDGLKFHRIAKGFMAQAGDPKGDGSGGCGYYLPLEAHSDVLHGRGILSMARTSHPDTAGSQFFLMFTRYPSLDPAPPQSPGYTVFGEMVEGEETLKKLEAVKVQIAPSMLERLKGRSKDEIEMMVRMGRVERAWPVEDVRITKASLVTLD